MANNESPFLFLDLRTRDEGASRAFYEALGDVSATTEGPPLFVGPDGTPWGGITALPDGDERRPQWIPYLGVPDVNAAAAEAERLGGTVVRPRVDLPNGSVVVVDDPGGATVALWQTR